MPTWLLVGLTAAATYVLAALLRQLTAREKKIQHRIEHLYPVTDEQFALSMEGLLPSALVSGNRVTSLINGEEIFDRMLNAIRAARRTITFETYIYWSGAIGREFSEALIERANAGVRVHVLLDWLGSKKMDAEAIGAMTDAGIEVCRYHPLQWYNVLRFNNRTHRKLLIVDGRIGFTGGVGIADQWSGNAQDPEHWRDSHFMVEGPSVAQLQTAFMDNWLKTQQCVLHGVDYFPKLLSVGASRAQVFMSSPGEGSESMRLMYLLSITSAVESIHLANSYFVPDNMTIAALAEACRRGVKVQVIVPGKHMDASIVRRASRSRWGPLLEAGAEIYEYRPTMYHCKIMVVDSLWVSVGSTNFDNRSFRLNDEANLNVLDENFAREQICVFELDKASSCRITLGDWKNRPWSEKLKEHAAGLLRTQL